MGCGSSKGAVDSAELLRLMRELQDVKNKSNEQQNLLRFKIEVLVNMLGIEEKKNETTEKRLETLKWMLHEQGVKEQTLTKILLNAEKDRTELEAEGALQGHESLISAAQRSISFHNIGLVDLSGAIERTRKEFELFKGDIIAAFAEEDGKLVPSLDSTEFMKQLYVVTEKLTKGDIQLLALRFGDGSGSVSIPEFLDFFVSPPEVRAARAATAAVRMSLDLLQLEVDMEEDPDYVDEGKEDEDGEHMDGAATITTKGSMLGASVTSLSSGAPPFRVIATHLSNTLERGTRRLLVLWAYVRDDLSATFEVFEQGQQVDQELYGQGQSQSQVISTDVFKGTLMEICGVTSNTLHSLVDEKKITLYDPTRPRPRPIADRRPVSAGRDPNHPEQLPPPNTNPNTNPNNTSMESADGKKPSRFSFGKKKGPDESAAPASPDGKAPAEVKGSAPRIKDIGKKHPKTGADAKGAAAPTDEDKAGKEEEKKEQGEEENVEPPHEVEPLDSDDIDMLAERFEVGGLVHWGHFIQFFKETYATIRRHNGQGKHQLRLPATISAAQAASPFRISSEWTHLKANSLLRQSSTSSGMPFPPAPESYQPQGIAAAGAGAGARAGPPAAPTKASSPSRFGRFGKNKQPIPPTSPASETVEDAKKDKDEEGNKDESKTDIPAVPDASADSKTQGNDDDQGDKKPGSDEKKPGDDGDKKGEESAVVEEKPTGPDVVEPKKGLFCCGGIGKKSANAPEPLPPPAEEKPEEKPEPPPKPERAPSEDSDDFDYNLKVDKEFRTPIDRNVTDNTGRKNKRQPSNVAFKPRRSFRDGDVSEEEDDNDDDAPARQGLGQRDDEDMEIHKQPRASSSSRFSRRTAMDAVDSDTGFDSSRGSRGGTGGRAGGRAGADSDHYASGTMLDDDEDDDDDDDGAYRQRRRGGSSRRGAGGGGK